MNQSREVNPFEASEQPDVRPVDPVEVAKTSTHRRNHLNAEITIRSIGWTLIVLAVPAIGTSLLVASRLVHASNTDHAEEAKTALIVLTILGGVFGLLGVGLARLNNLARMITGTLALFSIFITALLLAMRYWTKTSSGKPTPQEITTIVVGLFLVATLHSRKASNICWSKYHRVVELTPHIRYKASMFLRVICGIAAIVAMNTLIAKLLVFAKVLP